MAEGCQSRLVEAHVNEFDNQYSLWVFCGIGCIAEVTMYVQLGSCDYGHCLVCQSETGAWPDGCGVGASWELVVATISLLPLLLHCKMCNKNYKKNRLPLSMILILFSQTESSPTPTHL